MNQIATPSTVHASTGFAPRRNWFVYTLLFLLAGSALCIRELWPAAKRPLPNTPAAPAAPVPASETGPAPVDWTAGKNKIRERLRNIEEKTALLDSEAWNQFSIRSKSCRESGASRTLEAKVQSVNSLLAGSEVAALAFDFAQDKIRGGERALSRIQGHSRHLTDALVSARSEAETELRRIHERLREIDNDYALRIGEVVRESEAGVAPQTFAALTDTYEQVARKCAVTLGATSLAVLTEAAFAQTNVQSIKSIAAWLASALAPRIATISTSLMTAEIPVVDIISAGFLAWTVYDVCTLGGKIRADVDALFTEAMDAQLRGIDAAVGGESARIREQHRSARREAMNRVIAALD